MKKNLQKISSLLCICLLLNSCSTKLISPDRLLPEKTPNLQEYDYTKFSHKNFLEKIQSLNKKLTEPGKLQTIEEYAKLGQELSSVTEEYRLFLALEFNRKDISFSLQPNSKMTFKFNSYCLNPGKASPRHNEQFVFRKSSPDIPLYKDIMLHTNLGKKIKPVNKQLLFWNLKNDVKFENLPQDQQELLMEINPTAYLKINSIIKSEVKTRLTKYAKTHIPFYDDTQKTIDLLKGKAYTYQDYANKVEKLASTLKLLADEGPIKADGYYIYTLTQNSGFSSTTITFINITNLPLVISCLAFLDPLNNNVQPIGLDMPLILEEYEQYKNDIENEIDKMLVLLLYKIGNDGDYKSILDNIKNKRALLSFLGAGYMSTLYTKAVFLRNGTDDESDAFRHALWNALMVRDMGESLAEEFATNHEIFDKKQTQRQKDMDMHNNKAGRETGKELFEKGIKDELSYIKEILKNKNRLDVINKTGKESLYQP